MTTSTVLDYAARLDNGVKTYGQGDSAIHGLNGANAEFERGSAPPSWDLPDRGSRPCCIALRDSTASRQEEPISVTSTFRLSRTGI
jgi:hypothetical protein